jgi:hypothetical protein
LVEPFVIPAIVAVPGLADVLKIFPALGNNEPFVDLTWIPLIVIVALDEFVFDLE